MAVFQISTYLGLNVHLRPIYHGSESHVLNKRGRRFPGKGDSVAVGEKLCPMKTNGRAFDIMDENAHKVCLFLVVVPSDRIERRLTDVTLRKELARDLPNHARTTIIWLNSPQHSELALAFTPVPRPLLVPLCSHFPS